MQLTINFYREEKLGISMNKSITLYEKKYGGDSNTGINEFLKANALLKRQYCEAKSRYHPVGDGHPCQHQRSDTRL